jgi:prevent-host-death family protein
METVTAREAKNTFGNTLIRALQSPVQITRNGKPIAVLMSMDNYRQTEELKLAALKRMVDQADRELEAGDFTDGESFMQELRNGI